MDCRKIFPQENLDSIISGQDGETLIGGASHKPWSKVKTSLIYIHDIAINI